MEDALLSKEFAALTPVGLTASRRPNRQQVLCNAFVLQMKLFRGVDSQVDVFQGVRVHMFGDQQIVESMPTELLYDAASIDSVNGFVVSSPTKLIAPANATRGRLRAQIRW